MQSATRDHDIVITFGLNTWAQELLVVIGSFLLMVDSKSTTKLGEVRRSFSLHQERLERNSFSIFQYLFNSFFNYRDSTLVSFVREKVPLLFFQCVGDLLFFSFCIKMNELEPPGPFTEMKWLDPDMKTWFVRNMGSVRETSVQGLGEGENSVKSSIKVQLGTVKISFKHCFRDILEPYVGLVSSR